MVGLLWRCVYRTEVPVGPGDILDVGSNIGLAAAWFAHACPGRRIHCFEPLPDNVRMVRLNCPSARVSNVAVGATAGRLTLQADPDQVMATSIPTSWDTQPVEVDVLTLDDYAAQHGIERVALLKIDTEGMELEVFRGAPSLLERTDQVVLETHGRDRHRATLDLLTAAGFTIVREQFGDETGMVNAARGIATPNIP